MFADAEGLPECRMEDVEVDQDPAAILLELFVPWSNFVLSEIFNKQLNNYLMDTFLKNVSRIWTV